MGGHPPCPVHGAFPPMYYYVQRYCFFAARVVPVYRGPSGLAQGPPSQSMLRRGRAATAPSRPWLRFAGIPDRRALPLRRPCFLLSFWGCLLCCCCLSSGLSLLLFSRLSGLLVCVGLCGSGASSWFCCLPSGVRCGLCVVGCFVGSALSVRSVGLCSSLFLPCVRRLLGPLLSFLPFSGSLFCRWFWPLCCLRLGFCGLGSCLSSFLSSVFCRVVLVLVAVVLLRVLLRVGRLRVLASFGCRVLPSLVAEGWLVSVSLGVESVLKSARKTKHLETACTRRWDFAWIRKAGTCKQQSEWFQLGCLQVLEKCLPHLAAKSRHQTDRS